MEVGLACEIRLLHRRVKSLLASPRTSLPLCSPVLPLLHEDSFPTGIVQVVLLRLLSLHSLVIPGRATHEPGEGGCSSILLPKAHLVPTFPPSEDRRTLTKRSGSWRAWRRLQSMPLKRKTKALLFRTIKVPSERAFKGL